MKPAAGDHFDTLGECVRRSREKLGLTLRQLATSLGVSAPYVSDVEHNRRSITSERLEAFAKILQVEVDELARLSGRMTPDIAAYLRANPMLVAILREVSSQRWSGAELARLLRSIERRRP